MFKIYPSAFPCETPYSQKAPAKSNIKELLGEPQKVDFLANGLEKWEYSHLRKAAKAVNYVPVANWFVGGTNDKYLLKINVIISSKAS